MFPTTWVKLLKSCRIASVTNGLIPKSTKHHYCKSFLPTAITPCNYHYSQKTHWEFKYMFWLTLEFHLLSYTILCCLIFFPTHPLLLIWGWVNRGSVSSQTHSPTPLLELQVQPRENSPFGMSWAISLASSQWDLPGEHSLTKVLWGNPEQIFKPPELTPLKMEEKRVFGWPNSSTYFQGSA